MSLSAFSRRNTSRSRRRANTLVDEPTAVELLNFRTHSAAEKDAALNAWTAVDLNPDMMWSPSVGSGGFGANCRAPMMSSCALDPSHLAFLSGSTRSRYEPPDDNSESDRNLKHSSSLFSDWPESYQVLGEPLRYTMSAPEAASHTMSNQGSANKSGSVLARMQNENDDGGSVVSGMSSNLPRSKASSFSSFSILGESSVDIFTNNNNKKLVARRMAGLTICSDTSSHTVSTGLSIAPLFPSHEQQSRADVMIHEQAILKASLPAYIGGRYSRYVMAMTRTSPKQAFGLEFCTAETRDGKLSGIFISGEIPYLGMSRWDRLLSINGIEPKSIQEGLAMVKEQLLLVLVLQSMGRQSVEPVHTPDMKSLPLQDQRLLTIKKDMVEDNASDFKLRITRRSTKLRLDLPFDAKDSKDAGPLLATCDMPHLEILAGDRLLSVNGIRSLTQSVFAHLMNTAYALDLRLSRTGAGKPPPSKQLGTYEDPKNSYFQDQTGGNRVRSESYGFCMPDQHEENHEFALSRGFLHTSEFFAGGRS